MSEWLNRTHVGDCRELLARMASDGVGVQTCVTSPPYVGLRDYGHAGQIGLEPTPAEYVEQLVLVFRAVRDVLADDGTLWLNLGDSYAGSWGAQSREHAGNHAPNVSALSANQVKAAAIREIGTGSLSRTPGLKAKDLIGIPWRVAFALQADGWYLRSDIIWHKPNPMPESVTDRPTKAHEYVFLMAKSERYFYDSEAIKEAAETDDIRRPYGPGQVDARGNGHDRGGGTPRKVELANGFRGGAYVNGSTFDNSAGGARTSVGNMIAPEGFRRNKRSVWTIATAQFKAAHFATFPPDLIRPCILAGSRPADIVLDPFMGSGTTAQVATDLGRHFIGCELNPEYVELHDMRRTTIGMAI